ncbi:MAG: formate dehydrogenase [Desulfovibrio sp.]|nr:MAG: formate dehydrogenase [Desulfovibrio sp.]
MASLRKDRPELVQARYMRFSQDGFAPHSDVVTPEEPVFLEWPGRNPIKLWAFSEDLERLVLGHALLECCGPGEIPVIAARAGNAFILAPKPDPRRHEPPNHRQLLPEQVLAAMRDFIAYKGRWEDTGCFHRMGALDPETGAFPHMAEDIGRHNCVDRMAGWALDQGRDPAGLVLCVSARTTASLMHKILRAGFRCVISKSAATTAGMDMALAHNATLVGFARGTRFTVYVNSSRTISIRGGDIRWPTSAPERQGESS